MYEQFLFRPWVNPSRYKSLVLVWQASWTPWNHVGEAQACTRSCESLKDGITTMFLFENNHKKLPVLAQHVWKELRFNEGGTEPCLNCSGQTSKPKRLRPSINFGDETRQRWRATNIPSSGKAASYTDQEASVLLRNRQAFKDTCSWVAPKAVRNESLKRRPSQT